MNDEDDSPFTQNCRDMMSEMQIDMLTELREEADTPYPDRIRLSDVIARFYDKMLYIIEVLAWLSGLQYDPEMWLPKPDDNAEEELDVGRVEVPPFIITGGISDEPTAKIAQIEELSQQPSIMQAVLGQSFGKKSLSQRESSHANKNAQSASTVQNLIQDQSQGDFPKQKKILKKKNAKVELPTTQESDSETTVEDMKRYSRMSFLKTPTRFLALKNLMPKHSKRASSTLDEIPIESTEKDKLISEQKSAKQSPRNDEGDRSEIEFRSGRSNVQRLDISSESQEDSIESKYKKQKPLRDPTQKEGAPLACDIPKKHSPIHRTRRMKSQESTESTEQEHFRHHKKKEAISTFRQRRTDSQTLPQPSPRNRHERHYEETGGNKIIKFTPNKTM